jgi:hypothetical protein
MTENQFKILNPGLNVRFTSFCIASTPSFKPIAYTLEDIGNLHDPPLAVYLLWSQCIFFTPNMSAIHTFL